MLQTDIKSTTCPIFKVKQIEFSIADKPFIVCDEESIPVNDGRQVYRVMDPLTPVVDENSGIIQVCETAQEAFRTCMELSMRYMNKQQNNLN